MDIHQINALSNEAKAKYMALQRLFDQPGFKYLVEWARAQVTDSTQRELSAPNWEQVLLMRGARFAYGNFAEIEKYTEAEFADLADTELSRQAAEVEEKAETVSLENE
jgi:hypothetical protein